MTKEEMKQLMDEMFTLPSDLDPVKKLDSEIGEKCEEIVRNVIVFDAFLRVISNYIDTKEFATSKEDGVRIRLLTGEDGSLAAGFFVPAEVMEEFNKALEKDGLLEGEKGIEALLESFLQTVMQEKAPTVTVGKKYRVTDTNPPSSAKCSRCDNPAYADTNSEGKMHMFCSDCCDNMFGTLDFSVGDILIGEGRTE